MKNKKQNQINDDVESDAEIGNDELLLQNILGFQKTIWIMIRIFLGVC